MMRGTSLRDVNIWKSKWLHRFDPPVERLNRWVERQRRRKKHLPWFDPDDGGENARVLLLLESPGPRVEKTSFITRENDDPTARCVAEIFDEAGIDRNQLVAWNAVPWQCSTLRMDVLRKASPFTIDVLNLLPKLRAVVLMGGKAQRAWAEVEPLLGARRLCVHFCPHPARRAMNRENAKTQLRLVARRVKMLHL